MVVVFIASASKSNSIPPFYVASKRYIRETFHKDHHCDDIPVGWQVCAGGKAASI
jgi:hypothetical protein